MAAVVRGGFGSVAFRGLVYGYFSCGAYHYQQRYQRGGNHRRCKRLQVVKKITMPLMKPIFLFAFVMDAISSFKIYTEPNILIAGTGTLPTDAAPVMSIIANNIRSGNFGMASAAGWILFALILVISLAEMALLKNKDEEGGR